VSMSGRDDVGCKKNKFYLIIPQKKEIGIRDFITFPCREHTANMLHVYNFNCQEPVGVYVMYARHARRHKPTTVFVVVIVYAFFASYYPYVYERIQSEGLS
jgi:hypothetical protein